MEETIKNRIILVLAILTVIFFMGTISSCANARRQGMARDREMATRLDLEERMSKFTEEKTALGQKISALSQQLEEEKTTHQAAEKLLLNESSVNKELKDELDKVTKLKETLEEDLKEALVKGKQANFKKMK